MAALDMPSSLWTPLRSIGSSRSTSKDISLVSMDCEYCDEKMRVRKENARQGFFHETRR